MVARDKDVEVRCTAGTRTAGTHAAGPRTARTRTCERCAAAFDVSRRGMLGLLAGMTGLGALLQLGGCSSGAGVAQPSGDSAAREGSSEDASAPAKEELEVGEDQLKEDCKRAALDGASLAADAYLARGYKDLALKGVEDVSEQVDGTALTARFTAVCSTGEVELRRGMVATYEGGAGSWEYKDASVATERFRAVAGIDQDPLGRFGSGASVAFDEAAQTCRVEVEPKEQWFEKIEGPYVLRYAFGTDRWWFEGADTSAAKVSFENLLGEYVDPDNKDLKDDGCKLEVTDVADDGTVTVHLTVHDVDGGSSLFGIAPTDKSDTATMTGKMYYLVTADGTHRVGGLLQGKGDKSGRDFAWSFRADSKVTSGHGYTKVLKVASAEGSPLPSDGLLEVPEAQSATSR